MKTTLISFFYLIVGGYGIIRWVPKSFKWAIFAIFQVVLLIEFFFHSRYTNAYVMGLVVFLALYHWILVHDLGQKIRGLLPWLLVLLLVVVKWKQWPIVGASYVCFRLIYLTVEFENKIIKAPTFSMLLSHTLFFPTLLVGPITPSKDFFDSFGKFDRQADPIAICFYRILVGIIKVYYLSVIVLKTGFDGLWLDSYNHGILDFIICSVSYFAFLYFNFSGYCDLAIGAAGLLGIRIKENFNSPFVSRNVQEFWTRWHITLTDFMKELVFSPLLKNFLKKFGSGKAQLSFGVPLCIGITFFLLGIWHGLQRNYFIYGGLQALGVVTVHIYGNFIKKKLGPAKFKAYRENRFIYAVSWVLTFSFMTLSMFVFGNSYGRMMEILSQLKWVW